jgi:hypothetical protein
MTARWFKWDGERFVWIGWITTTPYDDEIEVDRE